MDTQDQNDINFMIFNVSEIDQINFTEILESTIETIRKSVNQTKTVVKWGGVMPECVANLTTKEGPYTYNEILTIMSTPEWTDPNIVIH